MVKANIIGSSSVRRHWRTVAEDCVRQLCDTTTVDWMSNGENAVHGHLWKIQRHPKGLRIYLDSGSHVTWKLGEKVTHRVMMMIASKHAWCSLAAGEIDAVGSVVIPREMTLN